MDVLQWIKNACLGSRQPVVHIPDIPHTQPVRRRYCFFGMVQGVGFRYEAMRVADQLGLTGWTRNNSDGTVTVEIEGDSGYIDEFLRVMQAVPRFDITDIQAEALPLSGDETTFNVLY